MSKDKLIVEEYAGGWRIIWWLAEENDTGAFLGDVPEVEDVRSSDEHCRFSALVIFIDPEVGRDDHGFFWDTEKEAKAALRSLMNYEKNSGKTLPEWAEKALAAGWKMPKGWKP